MTGQDQDQDVAEAAFHYLCAREKDEAEVGPLRISGYAARWGDVTRDQREVAAGAFGEDILREYLERGGPLLMGHVVPIVGHVGRAECDPHGLWIEAQFSRSGVGQAAALITAHLLTSEFLPLGLSVGILVQDSPAAQTFELRTVPGRGQVPVKLAFRFERLDEISITKYPASRQCVIERVEWGKQD